MEGWVNCISQLTHHRRCGNSVVDSRRERGSGICFLLLSSDNTSNKFLDLHTLIDVKAVFNITDKDITRPTVTSYCNFKTVLCHRIYKILGWAL